MVDTEKPDLEQLNQLLAEGLASGTPPWAGTEAMRAFPRLDSDEAAEAFVDTSDLSACDLSDMSPTGFEFAAKVAPVNMRLPAEPLEDVEAPDSARDTPGKNGRP